MAYPYAFPAYLQRTCSNNKAPTSMNICLYVKSGYSLLNICKLDCVNQLPFVLCTEQFIITYSINLKSTC